MDDLFYATILALLLAIFFVGVAIGDTCRAGVIANDICRRNGYSSGEYVRISLDRGEIQCGGIPLFEIDGQRMEKGK